jgi:hypothetical protein
VTPSSVTAGDYGDFGVAALNSGSVASFSATGNVPGGVLISTSSTASSGGRAVFSKGNNAVSVFGSSHIIHRALVSLSDTSNSTDDFAIEIRVGGANTVDSSINSVGLRYNHKINSGNWIVFSRDSGGSESASNSSIDVLPEVVYDVIICFDVAKSEARGYVNGQFAGVVTGNMPITGAVTSSVVIGRTGAIGTSVRSLRLHEMNTTLIHP